MALAASLATLLAVGIFAIVATAFGHRLLRLCGLDFASDLEQLLCSVFTGVTCFLILLFFAQILGHISRDVVVVLFAFALLGMADRSYLFLRASRLVRSLLAASSLERVLIASTGIVLLIEGLAAMAPLTGSDALHYHFTGPLLILQSGFHPDFFLSYSLLCGQSHLLILAGLALGSERLAMGLVFLGGVLAAAAGVCLASRWTSREWSWTVALVFLLTPVIFWQVSSAGAPDLWMAFFATLGVVVISRAHDVMAASRISHAVLAGALAGAVAGTKYTGCVFAAAMALAYFLEVRAAFRRIVFALAALGAGVWPYARNLVWTGDPVFPFLTRWISPDRFNAYALNSYSGDTGAAGHRSFLQVVEFPFFAAIDPAHLGFWQYLGPLVLAFAPLLLLVVRRTPAWRAALLVWLVGAIGIGAASGMSRFLLPVLPIALAAVLAAAGHLAHAGLRFTRYFAIATLSVLVLAGALGLVLYDRSAVFAATGFTPREEYLRAHAPEYQDAQFVNQTLAGQDTHAKALVFLRHVYYLRVPFLYGDPAASWAVDPAALRTPEQWRDLFRKNDIRWVVKSPAYPFPIAAPLNALEAQGKLVPIARSEVSDFQGLRINDNRQKRSIVVLKIID